MIDALAQAGKSVFQTVLGVWLFGDLMTTNRGASILVILAGTV
jgi:GDP-fucose transporter C1